jgi:CRISPR/Cas system-associated exonuclease Cas4 (RecB family)
VQQAWAQACEECAADGLDPRDRPDARRTLLRLERRLSNLIEFIDDCAPSQDLLTEQDLTSSDGQIRGTIDLIVLGGRPSIVDYKTGLVTEDGQTVDHYIRQLALYAHLVDDCLAVNVTRAALFSLREGIVTIDVSKAVRGPIVEECIAAQLAYNARVPAVQPAVPSSSACSYCAFVGVCDEFWGPRGVAGGFELTSGACIAGRVVSAPVLAASGVGAVQVALQVDSSMTTVTDVPNEILAAVEPGDTVRCWRLRADPAALSAMRWRSGQSALMVVASADGAVMI